MRRRASAGVGGAPRPWSHGSALTAGGGSQVGGIQDSTAKLLYAYSHLKLTITVTKINYTYSLKHLDAQHARNEQAHSTRRVYGYSSRRRTRNYPSATLGTAIMFTFCSFDLRSKRLMKILCLSAVVVYTSIT